MVMVVDDDPTSLKLMSTTLAQLGFQTCCESDGESALVTARRVKPSAVVLDLVMPGMGGFGFLEQFRREPDGQRVPVIVWTVKDLTPSEMTRLQASVQAVVSKGHGATTAVLSELTSFLQPRRES
jgi:twitching motility two-component system response regulator PilH